LERQKSPDAQQGTLGTVLLVKPQGNQLEVVTVLFVLTKHCAVEDEEDEGKVEVDVEVEEEGGMVGKSVGC